MKNSEMQKTPNSFALLLPVCAILITSVLWLRTGSQGPSACLDCVPIPLQLAGMLNGPVALFAYPFYPLVQRDVSAVHLAILVATIALQWAYIGFLIDKRHTGSPQRSYRRWMVGLLGVLFAFGPIAVAIRMYHVGLLYKVVSLAWSLLMGYHFGGYLRKGRGADFSADVSPS